MRSERVRIAEFGTYLGTCDRAPAFRAQTTSSLMTAATDLVDHRQRSEWRGLICIVSILGGDGRGRARRARFLAAGVAVGACALPIAPSSAQAALVRAVQASPSSAAPSPTITVSSAAAQTISGFGASGAWWPNDLGGFPARVQQRVADLLFGRRTGIGLSSYRYNIGGGGVGVRIPIAHRPRSWSAPGSTTGHATRAGCASCGSPSRTAYRSSAASSTAPRRSGRPTVAAAAAS